MADEEVIADLTPIGILKHLTPEYLEALKYYGAFGEFGQGEVVVKQGMPQNKLFIVVAGELKVTLKSLGEDILLGSIQKGDCFGELSIFEPGKASATVSVVKTAVLWHLSAESLQSFFDRLPAAGGNFMLGICQLLSFRLRQANDMLVKKRIRPSHLTVHANKRKEPLRAENVISKGGKAKPGIFKNIFK